MIFENEFDVAVTKEILKQSDPNCMLNCAIVTAFKQAFPNIVCDNNTYIEDAILLISVADVEDAKLGIIDVNFNFIMGDSLEQWMEDFDNGKDVEPINIGVVIECNDFDSGVSTNYVSGYLSMKEIS